MDLRKIDELDLILKILEYGNYSHLKTLILITSV